MYSYTHPIHEVTRAHKYLVFLLNTASLLGIFIVLAPKAVGVLCKTWAIVVSAVRGKTCSCEETIPPQKPHRTKHIFGDYLSCIIVRLSAYDQQREREFGYADK